MNNYFVYLKTAHEVEGQEELKINLTFLCLVSHCKTPEEAREQVLASYDEESLKELTEAVGQHEQNALIIVDSKSQLVKETLPEIIKFIEASIEQGEEGAKGLLTELNKIAVEIEQGTPVATGEAVEVVAETTEA